MLDDTPRLSRTLIAASEGDPRAAEELLPLVYAQLRRLAHARMADLPPGNTLQPTALVHEAYIRLVDRADHDWNTRGHFFGAAARAMRQILVEQARRKDRRRHGGQLRRVDADDVDIPIEPPDEDVLALDEALERLEKDDPRKAELVMYRYFAGLNREETAEVMGVSTRTVDRDWRYVRARLHMELEGRRGDG